MDTQLARFQASNSYGNRSNRLFSLLVIQLLAFSEIWTDSFDHVSRCKGIPYGNIMREMSQKMETIQRRTTPPPLMAIFPDIILPFFLLQFSFKPSNDACPITCPTYCMLHISAYLALFWQIYRRAKYVQVGYPWKDLAICSLGVSTLWQ